jgi:glucose/mannose transport system permease protein
LTSDGRAMNTRARKGPKTAWAAHGALLPMGLTVLVAYLASILWTVRISLSNSKMLPRDDWAGLSQYVSLFGSDRWLTALVNVGLFGIAFIAGALVLGFLLAVFIDQKVRLEGVLRTVYLCSFAMSFVACGVIWQWMFNPALGIQRSLRSWGWAGARFDWIATQDMAIYCVVIAVLWHSAGLVMAILLAGLRGIDDEQWKAARIEGVPRWRYYTSIVLPQLGPSLGTALVLLAVSVVKLYDAVVAMTNGGPGDATDVPTKFIIDNLFERQNIALASAASATMLVTVIVIVAPLVYARARANAAAGR